MAIEEPGYTIVKADSGDGLELRRYEAILVAEVEINGAYDEVGNAAFRKLAAYIFGGNGRGESIAMTAPVNTIPAFESNFSRLRAAGDGKWRVQFTMPAKYNLDSLPKADDPTIVFRRIPAATVAVARYSGSWSLENARENSSRLQAWIKAQGWVPEGGETLARYNSPFALWFLRRNEVQQAVAVR